MSYLEVGNLTVALKYLEKLQHWGQQFPDFPKNGTFIPPQLVNPNYIIPYRQNAALPIVITSTVLYTIVVFARLYTRRFHGLRIFGPDDWIMCVAWLAGLVFSIINVLLLTDGATGRNTYDLSIPVLRRGLLLEHWDYIAYILTQTFLRLSILAFFLRLAGPVARTLRRVTWVTIYVHFAVTFTSSCVALFSCRPLAASWDLNVQLDRGTCPGKYPGVMAVSILWSITDFWVVLLPIPTVVSLNMPLRSRIGVTVLFLIGIIASICGVVRIFAVPGAFHSWNPTWNGIGVIIWDQLEISFGFIAASLPALNVFISRAIPKKLKRGSNSAHSAPRYLRDSSRKSTQPEPVNEFELWEDPGPTESKEKAFHEHTAAISENNSSDAFDVEHGMRQSLQGGRELDETRRSRRWDSTFGYMDRDEEAADIASSLSAQRPWNLELGQPQNHDLPDITALSRGSISIVRNFSPTR